MPIWDALRHLGLRGAIRAVRLADALMDTSMPWQVDNRELLKPHGCPATNCAECGHCQRVAERAVRPK